MRCGLHRAPEGSAVVDRRSYRAAGARCIGASSATPRSSAVPVGRLGVVLHGGKGVWKLVDREPERLRSRTRPRDVDTWENSAAVRCVLGLGAASRCGAYPPM
jgi:hypothetical protein